MNNEEYTAAQQVIAEGNTSLAFRALQEANDELQSKIDSYIEDLNRLRTSNRTLRTVNKALRAQVESLIADIEVRDDHIFQLAEKEFVAEGATQPANESEFVDAEPADDGRPSFDAEEQAFRARMAARGAYLEARLRAQMEVMYAELRNEGEYSGLPLTPAEVYEAGQKSRPTHTACSENQVSTQCSH
jgi:hypothetical protein